MYVRVGAMQLVSINSTVDQCSNQLHIPPLIMRGVPEIRKAVTHILKRNVA